MTERSSFDFKVLSRYRTQLMGLSILWVIFYHFCAELPLYDFLSPVIVIKKLGFAGVDIFFFLSGYGLAYGWTRTEGRTLRGFYLKRFKRIYPKYTLAVLFFTILIFVIRDQYDFPMLAYRITMLDFVVNGNKTLWYIPVQIIFYILFPTIFDLLSRQRATTYLVLILSELLLIGLIQLYFNYLLVGAIRLPIFTLGVYVGIRCISGDGFSVNRNLLAGIGFMSFLLAAGLHYLNSGTLFLSQTGIKWMPIFFLTPPICALFCGISAKLNAKPVRAVVTQCGQLSLELYLVHEFIQYIYFRLRTVQGPNGWLSLLSEKLMGTGLVLFMLMSLSCAILLKLAVDKQKG